MQRNKLTSNNYSQLSRLSNGRSARTSNIKAAPVNANRPPIAMANVHPSHAAQTASRQTENQRSIRNAHENHHTLALDYDPLIM